MEELTPGESKVPAGPPALPHTQTHTHVFSLSPLGFRVLQTFSAYSFSPKTFKINLRWIIAIALFSIIKQFLIFLVGRKEGKHCPCKGSTVVRIEVRGQKSGWPSPLGVISPVVIWLAETLASAANPISKPGGHLGQITFLLNTDWTYGEINGQSCDSKHSDCFWWLCLLCLTPQGTQLVYRNIILLQTKQWSYWPNNINVQECFSGDSWTKTALYNDNRTGQ